MVNLAIETRGICYVALSGGETPRSMYGRLGRAPFMHSVDWSKVHLFFGDERAVPPTDQQSNFGMIDHEFISRIEIPATHVHRILGEISPEEAALDYERELEEAFGGQEVRFDLVLLGLGEDGHTASLFPAALSAEREEGMVCPVYVPLLDSWRVSLTLRVINNARRILFLVSGANKSSTLKRVLEAQEPTAELPATFVLPKEGTLLWMVDNDAAAEIKGQPGLESPGR